MNDGYDIRSFPVDAEVHFDFGRRLEAFISMQDVALGVDFADVFGGHKALGHTGGCAEKFVGTDLDGDVAVVGCDHSSVINSSADFTNLLFDSVFGCHGDLLSFYEKICLNGYI